MMPLYCPKCQNLVVKVDAEESKGQKIVKKCDRCYSNVEFYIKYKAVAKIVFERAMMLNEEFGKIS